MYKFLRREASDLAWRGNLEFWMVRCFRTWSPWLSSFFFRDENHQWTNSNSSSKSGIFLIWRLSLNEVWIGWISCFSSSLSLRRFRRLSNNYELSAKLELDDCGFVKRERISVILIPVLDVCEGVFTGDVPVVPKRLSIRFSEEES